MYASTPVSFSARPMTRSSSSILAVAMSMTFCSASCRAASTATIERSSVLTFSRMPESWLFAIMRDCRIIRRDCRHFSRSLIATDARGPLLLPGTTGAATTTGAVGVLLAPTLLLVAALFCDQTLAFFLMSSTLMFRLCEVLPVLFAVVAVVVAFAAVDEAVVVVLALVWGTTSDMGGGGRSGASLTPVEDVVAVVVTVVVAGVGAGVALLVLVVVVAVTLGCEVLVFGAALVILTTLPVLLLVLVLVFVTDVTGWRLHDCVRASIASRSLLDIDAVEYDRECAA